MRTAARRLGTACGATVLAFGMTATAASATAADRTGSAAPAGSDSCCGSVIDLIVPGDLNIDLDVFINIDGPIEDADLGTDVDAGVNVDANIDIGSTRAAAR